MRSLLLFLTLLLLVSCVDKSAKKHSSVVSQIEVKMRSSEEMFSVLRNDRDVSPRSVEDDTVVMVPSRDWTSGFYPGELWLMFELTKDVYWKERATIYTRSIEDQKWNGKTHDMGFKMYCSFGKAWELTHDVYYRDVLIQSAKTLATRFKPNVGCLRSWDHNTDKWDYPVIIDNMMNLELLFWAAKETGNEMYRQIAISHARTTMKNHFRADNSSYHVVDYDPETGEVEGKTTHQGYAPESAWSRGQAWGLYGYTMVYRETGDPVFLEQAEKIATFILEHPRLPDCYVPYWDFDAPGIPDAPYDASAAAVIASALYELSAYSTHEETYLQAADKMYASLMSSEFLADPKENNGFLLKHSTGSKPHNSEIDVPLVYADYYFIEMIKRKVNLSITN